eukprot:1146321-Pelagomonas_calceolata.AAC.8
MHSVQGMCTLFLASSPGHRTGTDGAAEVHGLHMHSVQGMCTLFSGKLARAQNRNRWCCRGPGIAHALCSRHVHAFFWQACQGTEQRQMVLQRSMDCTCTLFKACAHLFEPDEQSAMQAVLGTRVKSDHASLPNS